MTCNAEERMRSTVFESVNKIESDIIDASVPDSWIEYKKAVLHGMMRMCAISDAISIDDENEIYKRIETAMKEFRPNL